MIYGINICDKKTGDPKYFEDTLLPGLYLHRANIENMQTLNVERLGLCRDCTLGDRCHVLVLDELYFRGSGKVRWLKVCPVLFSDAIDSAWKVQDLA